ncbi:Mini-ribonuclease 3 [Desulforamulus ferrireducens]|uniref:Mini-ribonuclease 3 n=1 Tax=Desulforamulus ferrireducens TaxID=1833852 RepID=A0A1S6IT49_9FIRM|nr:ribonuclease III domain-containing protein [Desulforamulus ferrireducens]AQS57944.1 ribonuclease III [Desulforamulus ferrireducens]
MKEQRPEELPSLVLAYVGDAVYELAIREILVKQGYTKVNLLHKEAVRYVKAAAQAKALFAMEEMLTAEEQAVVRRGRNAKIVSLPKNADYMDYRHATALEALIGYLYLQGKQERVQEIVGFALEAIVLEK